MDETKSQATGTTRSDGRGSYLAGRLSTCNSHLQCSVIFDGTDCPVCAIETRAARAESAKQAAELCRDRAIDLACRYQERTHRAEAELAAIKDVRFAEEHPEG